MAKFIIEKGMLLAGLLLLGCGLSAMTRSPAPEPSRDTAAAVKSTESQREIGKALIQRYVTSARGGKIFGDLCLITENAVTLTRSVYNIRTAQNTVQTYQKFFDLRSESLKDSIAAAIRSPQVMDERSRSDENSVAIFLFDPKDGDNPGLEVLFSHNNSGLAKKDSPVAANLIATTEEFCAAVLESAKN